MSVNSTESAAGKSSECCWYYYSTVVCFEECGYSHMHKKGYKYPMLIASMGEKGPRREGMISSSLPATGSRGKEGKTVTTEENKGVPLNEITCSTAGPWMTRARSVK